MKEVLSLVIEKSQSAFLRDKGMLDSVLMTNKVVEEELEERNLLQGGLREGI